MPSAHESSGLSRRTVVRTGLGVAVAVPLIAACSSDDPPTTTTPAGTGSGGLLPKLDDITVGQAVAATLNGAPIVVARPTDATVAGFTAVCTHMQCTVNVNGAELNCPCHGSKYNALTGAVEQGPATQALGAVPLSVKDGQVVAG
jgi:Rieske Fe-S protein